MPILSKRFKTSLALVIFPIVILLLSLSVTVKADDKCASISDLDDKAECYDKEYQSTSKKLTDVQNQKNAVSQKITQLSSQLNITQSQLNEVNNDIKNIEDQLSEIVKNLEDRKNKLSDKISIRNHLVRNYMKRAQLNTVELFFTQSMPNINLNGFEFSYFSQALNKAASDETIKIIQGLNSEISGFEKDKKETEDIQKELNDQKNKMVALKATLDNQKTAANSEYNSLNEKEKSYSQKLAELSAKQQEILKQKNGEGYNSVGDFDSPSTKTPDPPFKPAFAAFSYGAYTHYNGMSQYGAKGRAEDGKKYKEILKFYYKADVKEKSDFPDKISVQGYGTIDFQYYLYGIAEMPTDWPLEALKAQAIAARTYAYKASKPICTTESCQVFNKSKADKVKSGQYANWKKAVDDTKAEILDNAKTSQYSSTTGGYINNVGWDIDGKWPNDAYEKKAGSPWFYKAWYTKGYSGTDSCSHPHPWLTEKEMADILNSWVVWRKGSSSEKGHISPVTTKCWGGDPYSLDEMANKAADYGEKYTSVSSIDADISTSGITAKVKISTNRGSIEISGEEFKTVFNLRAPAYISIKSRLFDLEKRN